MEEWLTCEEELLKEFTKEEIETAIKEAGYTVEDLTDKDDFEQEPRFIQQKELVKDWHTGRVKRTMNHKGLSWEAWETARVRTYRVKGHYQGLKHNKIIFNLLKNRLSWFPQFKWTIYGFTYGTMDKYEIYMKTERGSLYVPILALLRGNPEIIKLRMTTYFSEYYRTNKEQREKHLDILEAEETKKLMEKLSA